MSVTHRPKCYVYVCVGCNLLDHSERSDQLTCSPACRVRAHRNGSLQTLHALAKTHEVTPASIQQAAAVQRLATHIGDQVMARVIDHAEAQRQVWPIFWSLLTKHLEGNVT
jgi:hypothetical protein